MGGGVGCTRHARIVAGFTIFRAPVALRRVKGKHLLPYNASAQGIENGGGSSPGANATRQHANFIAKQRLTSGGAAQGTLPAAVGTG